MKRWYQQIRKEKGLTLQAIATLAGVPVTDAYVFEIGGKVDGEIDQKLLKAFSQLTPLSSVEEQPTVTMHSLGRSQRFIGGEYDLH